MEIATLAKNRLAGGVNRHLGDASASPSGRPFVTRLARRG
jgi:hypothetical protein